MFVFLRHEDIRHEISSTFDYQSIVTFEQRRISWQRPTLESDKMEYQSMFHDLDSKFQVRLNQPPNFRLAEDRLWNESLSVVFHPAFQEKEIQFQPVNTTEVDATIT